MGFSCGIVGLPNVGKSTLFNALTSTAAAEAQNYPFCTIEPNVGRVTVPDFRLDRIAEIEKPQAITPTRLDFVDIAGLVAGASKGEGLGNRFLANIREVAAIVHVLRCFEDPDITHVSETPDPVRDARTVETELMLADLETLEKRVDPLSKKAQSGEREARRQMKILTPILQALREGRSARAVMPSDPADRKFLKSMQLLTAKPVLYVCNVDESAAAEGNAYSRAVEEMAAAEGAGVVRISAAIESEIASLSDPAEKAEFLESLGLAETGLSRVIRAGYALWDLVTFFTAGPKEVRAWTVKKGATAPQAAGVIHTDFERGFIRAEVVSFSEFLACGGEQGAREAGKLRSEGKEYIVADGDVIHFLFNV